jgi:response regulator RpfG family c-di-GMP phosphodiesterase
VEHARRELRQGAGSQFDPTVVDLFLAAIDAPEERAVDTDPESSHMALPGLALKAQAS